MNLVMLVAVRGGHFFDQRSFIYGYSVLSTLSTILLTGPPHS